MANTESTVQIIPYYAHPHVHFVINDNTMYDETVATAGVDDLPWATAIVTGADRGIDNTFVRINKVEVKNALFGEANFKKYGQASIQADVLFNGSTNVWFMRVLPDNATYANIVFLMHYRRGKILDDLGQETGLYRLEVKFSTAYCNKPYVAEGAKGDDDIEVFAESLTKTDPDPQTGYMTVPLCFVRSIGRGKYGNGYSIAIARDSDAEKEYDMKMYRFNLLDNADVTRITNVFSGSFYQTTRYNMSTLISDVLDQFSTGSCPVSITSFEDNFLKVYDFYKEQVVTPNVRYLQASGTSTAESLADAEYALSLTETTFDPLFGYKLNTRTGEQIPYYRNYTVKSTGAYVAPDLTVPNIKGAVKPLNISDWSAAKVGSRVLVVADPNNDGYRWLYTITSIDPDTGNIVYDEGYEVYLDDDQYDGINISLNVGHMLSGGHDGDFQEITVNGEARAPSDAEMKLLLAREQVKAWRGEKDRKILSPARTNIDFLYDANYNMTNDVPISTQNSVVGLFGGSTVLTDKDNQRLSVLGVSDTVLEFNDLNVKKAMYDLNEFRNRNGMTVNLEQGAGGSLYLDTGIIGLKNVGVNYELMDIINMMSDFTGRGCSIDLGYYSIYDPVSTRRIQVTTSYYIAKNLVPHIMKYGLNKPFTNSFAKMTAIQRDRDLTVKGDMIRDSFRPDIDLIDWDVKERLYNSRINYWLTEDEGRTVTRSTQNTRQLDASCLLEENNVRILNTLKKGLEKACRGYHYEWNSPTARKGYTDSQTEVYRPWIGTVVEDLEIVFEANEWEQKRMIMHCYCIVKFKDIVKRVILEINIERPNYDSGGEA